MKLSPAGAEARTVVNESVGKQEASAKRSGNLFGSSTTVDNRDKHASEVVVAQWLTVRIIRPLCHALVQPAPLPL